MRRRIQPTTRSRAATRSSPELRLSCPRAARPRALSRLGECVLRGVEQHRLLDPVPIIRHARKDAGLSVARATSFPPADDPDHGRRPIRRRDGTPQGSCAGRARSRHRPHRRRRQATETIHGRCATRQRSRPAVGRNAHGVARARAGGTKSPARAARPAAAELGRPAADRRGWCGCRGAAAANVLAGRAECSVHCSSRRCGTAADRAGAVAGIAGRTGAARHAHARQPADTVAAARRAGQAARSGQPDSPRRQARNRRYAGFAVSSAHG